MLNIKINDKVNDRVGITGLQEAYGLLPTLNLDKKNKAEQFLYNKCKILKHICISSLVHSFFYE